MVSKELEKIMEKLKADAEIGKKQEDEEKETKQETEEEKQETEEVSVETQAEVPKEKQETKGKEETEQSFLIFHDNSLFRAELLTILREVHKERMLSNSLLYSAFKKLGLLEENESKEKKGN